MVRLLQLLQIIFLRDGLGIQIPLYVFAADAHHEISLFDGLHTFYDDGSAKPLCHLDHRPYDYSASSAYIAVQEIEIKLNDVNIQILQDVK